MADKATNEKINQQIKILLDPQSSEEKRTSAMQIIKEIGEPALPALIEALISNNDNVSSEASSMIAKIDPQVAIPALKEVLLNPSNHSSKARTKVAVLLGAYGQQDSKIIDAPTRTKIMNALMGGLTDPDENVRTQVAFSLGFISAKQEKNDPKNPIWRAAADAVNTALAKEEKDTEEATGIKDSVTIRMLKEALEVIRRKRKTMGELPAEMNTRFAKLMFSKTEPPIVRMTKIKEPEKKKKEPAQAIPV